MKCQQFLYLMNKQRAHVYLILIFTSAFIKELFFPPLNLFFSSIRSYLKVGMDLSASYLVISDVLKKVCQP